MAILVGQESVASDCERRSSLCHMKDYGATLLHCVPKSSIGKCVKVRMKS